VKNITIVCSAAALVFSASIPVFAQSTGLGAFFDQANQMNKEEQDMAKELSSKAGDNQTLVTMADTMLEDHKANQSALEALAKQKNVTLKSYEKNQDAQNQLDNLNEAEFNKAFLNMNIKDHEAAIASFRRAKDEVGSDPDIRVYIDQTVPVLEAHLKMAENLRHDDELLGSRENPMNNKKTD
jgi:putative membrane protein